MRAVLKRLLIALLTLAGASGVIFLTLARLPGDPAALLLGLNATPERLAALRAEMGLDRSLGVQYLDWIGGLLTGDLGRSLTYGVPVSELVEGRIGVSLPLAAGALLLSCLIALPAGLLAARLHAGGAYARIGETALSGAVQVGLAIPNFWLGLLAVHLLALTFGLFPASGFPGWSEPGRAVHALTLPALALALPQGAILARVVRASLLDEVSRDYVRTARAKGASRGRALVRHALPNAMVPVLTVIGLQFAFLIAGTIVVEAVFALPGLGRLVHQAVTQRDLATVRSVVMMLAAAVIVINTAVDLAAATLDPRLRRAKP